MQHSVRTAFGDPTSVYGGDKWVVPLTHPLQGLIQSNIAAKSIWGNISTNIINFLRDTCHGAVFKWFPPGNTLKQLEYLFVDNSIIIKVAPSPNYPNTETVSLTQQGINILYSAAQAIGLQVII